MLVIPAINETEFSEVLEKINIVSKFSRWVHLDVVDGKFAPNITWNNPKDLISNFLRQSRESSTKSGQFPISKLNIEVHLMAENPEAAIKNWVSAGVKRIIISLEALLNIGKSDLTNITQFLEVGLPKFEIGLAINPETPVENLIPFISINQRPIKFVLVLGVDPGLAGQKFKDNILEKIKFLKTYYPGVNIEADGGINPETAKLIKEAGADIIVSASYIWENQNPERAYQELAAI